MAFLLCAQERVHRTFLLCAWERALHSGWGSKATGGEESLDTHLQVRESPEL